MGRRKKEDSEVDNNIIYQLMSALDMGVKREIKFLNKEFCMVTCELALMILIKLKELKPSTQHDIVTAMMVSPQAFFSTSVSLGVPEDAMSSGFILKSTAKPAVMEPSPIPKSCGEKCSLW